MRVTGPPASASHHTPAPPPRPGSLALLNVHFAVKTVKAGGPPRRLETGGLKLEAPSLTWAVSLFLEAQALVLSPHVHQNMFSLPT